jgi:hypothetical protein
MLDEIRHPSNRHHASPSIREIDMISCNLLFVPFVFSHAFVVINAFERHLTKTVEFGQVNHMFIEELPHKVTSLRCVVKLYHMSLFLPREEYFRWLTMVHRTIPYLTINPFVIGPETCVMCRL